MPDLSVIIPARNERWLSRTVYDVCAHKRGDTDVIVILDGAWPEAGYELKQHPDVQVVYLPQPIGQRAATNLGARVSTARYVMKLDGHCSLADGFDVALLEAAAQLGPHVVQVPAQRHLWVYDQVCDPCGWRADQAPHHADCPTCGGPLRQDVIWKMRGRPRTTAWRFDADLHFQYRGFVQEAGDYPETMSCLGACWFLDRAWFLELGGLDEAHGSWGQMGTELACKAWLSGGRMVCNTKTEFAHFFRVGGIGFPYAISGSDQEAARTYSQNLWRSDAWAGQVKPLRWLVEKFRPEGWSQEQIEQLPEGLETAAGSPGPAGMLSSPRSGHSIAPAANVSLARRGIAYYSDCLPDPQILTRVRQSIEASGLPIVAVTLKPIEWDAGWIEELRWYNPLLIWFEGERGYLTMFKQILAGLEELETDYAFLCEHDVLYHHSHFDFVPPRDDCYFYNTNTVKLDAATGKAVTYVTKQVSGLCANRELLVAHYRERVRRVELDGFSRRMGFEPGSHRRPERIDDVPSDVWRSEFPNIDIRHGHNLTPSRWSPDQFRDKRHCEGFREVTDIPGWGRAADLVAKLRGEVAA